MTKYCFVLDADEKPLAPTQEAKGWYLIRKNKANLVSKFPMVIKLKRVIPKEDICSNEIHCGIDDGSLYVGIALVQKCNHYNKVVFKGVIEQRKDVKHLMEVRKNYRRYRRYHKRYRKQRYLNRKSSKRADRNAPSILQKRQAIIRVINQLNKWVAITSFWLEDVSIDIRALTDGYKPYKWQYQKSNRLDENIRKAVILRDECMCKECGKTNVALEVHHITPRRLKGSNTLGNMISLCPNCHQKTKGVEEKYMEHFYNMLNSSNNFMVKYASHVMNGKNWLRKKLSELGNLYLTTGGDTANKRIDWGIEKTHSNDAICITNLKPNTTDIQEYIIKPMRRQSKANTDELFGIRHRDYIKYTRRDGTTYKGYVTSLVPKKKELSFLTPQKHFKKMCASRCTILWRYSKIYWFDYSA